MLPYNEIEELPREKLLELLTIYAKDWLATDGLWFQSIEKKRGMEEAMEHDVNVWRRLGVIEAQRIRTFLQLPERAGIEGLRRALSFRLYSPLNKVRLETEGNTLTCHTESCRVQAARRRKGMPLHPCKRVGVVEYTAFSQTIDDRFTLECISCYPDLTDPGSACIWQFTLH